MFKAMGKIHQRLPTDHGPKNKFAARRTFKTLGLSQRKRRRIRVVRYSDMTDAQQRICNAAEGPGTPVPTDLPVDDLAAWFVSRAAFKVSTP